MFAGHIGAGLALGAIEHRRNPGVLVLAALLSDGVLWLLVLAGVERVIVPPDYAARHYLGFVFPDSHGLLATVAWSMGIGLAAAAASSGPGRLRWGALAAAAVLSHFVLDALVHPPELPLVIDASTGIGLGLWDRLPLALGLETALTVAGLALYLRARAPRRGRAIALAAVVLLVLVLTVAGQALAPPPPSSSAVAVSSLTAIGVVVVLVALLTDRSAARSRSSADRC